VEVEIGMFQTTNNDLVDEFNQLVMDLFNCGSSNMLLPGTILSWNVWFRGPGLVDREEWKNHAERWRDSIDADHGSPDGPGTIARYIDGKAFNPVEGCIEDQINIIFEWLKKHLLRPYSLQ
jgi:hypothetical protein